MRTYLFDDHKHMTFLHIATLAVVHGVRLESITRTVSQWAVQVRHPACFDRVVALINALESGEDHL